MLTDRDGCGLNFDDPQRARRPARQWSEPRHSAAQARWKRCRFPRQTLQSQILTDIEFDEDLTTEIHVANLSKLDRNLTLYLVGSE